MAPSPEALSASLSGRRLPRALQIKCVYGNCLPEAGSVALLAVRSVLANQRCLLNKALLAEVHIKPGMFCVDRLTKT